MKENKKFKNKTIKALQPSVNNPTAGDRSSGKERWVFTSNILYVF